MKKQKLQNTKFVSADKQQSSTKSDYTQISSMGVLGQVLGTPKYIRSNISGLLTLLSGVLVMALYSLGSPVLAQSIEPYFIMSISYLFGTYEGLR